jgi:sarcosine oxidase/sarcosine oxidase subunit beta
LKQKALIVGGGIAGLSTAWALARRGFEVHVFEQGPLPNPKCSSYDEHRIIRHAYGHFEGYAQLMPAAFRTWERLWADIGTSHYEPTGAVYFLRKRDAWYDVTTRTLDGMGIGYRDIPLAAVPDRFPMVALDGLQQVLETDGAGMLFPIRILTDMVVLLGRMGVHLHSYAKVSEVDPLRGRVTLGATAHDGDVVVVAAGAWADRLVPELRGVAVPSRQAVLYLAPPPDLAPAWDRAPVMLDHSPEGGLYTLPPRRGTRLKIGDHKFSRSGDADEDRVATARDLERLWPAARLAYRDLDRYAVLEPKACFYTVTEGEEFYVRPLGPASWVISACSGHGFKLGALMGEGVAAAIAGERPAEGVPDWAAGRLRAPVAA